MIVVVPTVKLEFAEFCEGVLLQSVHAGSTPVLGTEGIVSPDIETLIAFMVAAAGTDRLPLKCAEELSPNPLPGFGLHRFPIIIDTSAHRFESAKVHFFFVPEELHKHRTVFTGSIEFHLQICRERYCLGGCHRARKFRHCETLPYPFDSQTGHQSTKAVVMSETKVNRSIIFSR